MNRQVVELGFLLNQIPGYEFSMSTFADRLKLQKALYLLQSFGIYLGYDFSWYMRGPYCPSVVINGFALESIYTEIPKNKKTEFRNSDKQKLFEKFQRLVKDKDMDELEILSLLHYQKVHRKLGEAIVKDKVVKKMPRFTKEMVDEMWNELEKYGLLGLEEEEKDGGKTAELKPIEARSIVHEDDFTSKEEKLMQEQLEEQVKEEKIKEIIDTSMDINLKNFVDKALMQTLMDSIKKNDGPLRILNTIPFQGDKIEKDIDRLRLDESLVAPIIFRKKSITY